jgi:hypothetical protein
MHDIFNGIKKRMKFTCPQICQCGVRVPGRVIIAFRKIAVNADMHVKWVYRLHWIQLSTSSHMYQIQIDQHGCLWWEWRSWTILTRIDPQSATRSPERYGKRSLDRLDLTFSGEIRKLQIVRLFHGQLTSRWKWWAFCLTEWWFSIPISPKRSFDPKFECNMIGRANLPRFFIKTASSCEWRRVTLLLESKWIENRVPGTYIKLRL